MKELVSVIIPAYNAESYIIKAVNSILLQTYDNMEVVITDDCSTDNTYSLLQSIHDNRLKLYRNDKNSGVSATLNNCILKSEGSLIAVMHADDIAHADRIEIQAEYLKVNDEVTVVGSQCENIDEVDKALGLFNVQTDSYELLLDTLLKKIPFPHPSVMYRREAILKVNLYNSKYDGMEDHDMWLRLAAAGHKFGNIPKSLLKYRRHSTQLSQNYTLQDINNNYSIFFDYIKSIGLTWNYEEVVKYCNICNNSYFTVSLQEFKFFLHFFTDILNNQRYLSVAEKKLIKKCLFKKLLKTKPKKKPATYLDFYYLLKWV